MLLAAARTEAEALAMAPLLSRCDALAVQLREGGGRGIGLRLPDRLTRKELEVLRMVASGLSNREVAERLAISLNTVERHINHLFDKTKVENRVALVNYAHRLGLVG